MDYNIFTKYALQYIEKNISFYPLDKLSKMPAIIEIIGNKAKRIEWKKYRERIPATEEAIHWFEELKLKGIAIITGNISRLAIIDCDDKNSTKRFIAEYLAQTKQNPLENIHVKTRRGMHFYFKLEEDDIIPSSQSIINGYKIELKAEKSSIKAPPSFYSDNTGRYRFKGKELPTLPNWIRKIIKNKEKLYKEECKIKECKIDKTNITKNQRLERIFNAALRIPESRNRACFWMCKTMLSVGATNEETKYFIYRFIQDINNTNDHPFTEEEAISCLISASKYI